MISCQAFSNVVLPCNVVGILKLHSFRLTFYAPPGGSTTHFAAAYTPVLHAGSLGTGEPVRAMSRAFTGRNSRSIDAPVHHGGEQMKIFAQSTTAAVAVVAGHFGFRRMAWNTP